MKRFTLIIGVLMFWSWQWKAVAETINALEKDGTGWVDVQPTANLEGWTRLPFTTNVLGRQQWHVDQSGVLVCDGDGGHDMLQFRKELADGIFHVEFRYTPIARTNPRYNSGVFIRNSADGTIWHQAQLTLDGGYLLGNSPVGGTSQRFRTSPTERRMKAAGEWNTMEVTAQGKVLRVWLNGAETCVWDQCAVSKGSIALEGEGYRIEFRNLKYKPLD